VPDAGLVVDYNRFAYARGNPLKYTDPSGHCATLEDGGPDINGDQACWEAADEWLKTFGAGGYENTDQWQKNFAGQAAMTEDVFRTVLHTYWAPQYRAMGVYHKRYNPPPEMHPVTSEDQAFEQLVHSVTCEDPSACITNTLNVVGTGGAGIAAVCTIASGGICAVIAGPAGAISIAVGGISTAYTAYQVMEGESSEADLATAATMFTVGAAREVGGEAAKKINPWFGFGASIYQWIYDSQ